MVIAGLVLLSMLLIRAYNWRIGAGGQEIRIRFDYVGGLLENAPVHMYGMEIGEVNSVRLVGDGVEVGAKIHEDVSIREGYRILIDILGLVGEKYVEIINGPADNPVTKDEPLRGISPISVGQVLMKADEITDKTIGTIDFVQEFISQNEKEINAGVTELKNLILEARGILRRTMGDVDTLMERINNLAECTEGDVSQTLASLKAFTEELNTDREEIGSLIGNVTRNLDQLVTRSSPAIEKSLENLQEISEELPNSAREVSQDINELSKSVSQFVAKLDEITDSSNQKLQKGLDDFSRSAAGLNETLDRIDGLIAEVESGRGTLGRLMTDESSYRQLDETMTAGKRAIEDVSDVTRSLNRKIRFFDSFNTTEGYELSYGNLTDSLRNQFTLSSTRSGTYFYLAGLSVRDGELAYDVQVGRRFGDLMARVGSIRSRAGIGLDYWPFSKRVGISLEGVDVTDRRPEVDLDVLVRLFGGWYFILGAEDLAGSKIGFNFGFRAEMGH